jgi:hypothetical protein
MRRSQFHEPEDDVAAALAGVAAGSHGSSGDERMTAWRPRRAGEPTCSPEGAPQSRCSAQGRVSHIRSEPRKAPSTAASTPTHRCSSRIPRGPSSAAGKGEGEPQMPCRPMKASGSRPCIPPSVSCVRPSERPKLIESSAKGCLIRRPGRSGGRTQERRRGDWRGSVWRLARLNTNLDRVAGKCRWQVDRLNVV